MRLPNDMGLWDWFKDKIRSQSKSTFTMIAAPIALQTLDLHGLTVQEAYDDTRDHIWRARAAKAKTVEIITGRSGQIRREFPAWMACNDDVKRIEALNGGGAFRVFLR